MSELPTSSTTAIERLLEIMRRLRSPDGGCPWDREQTYETIAPYTIEEAYEVADAIERKDMADLKDELGDLLFQVVFHSQMASEAGDFTFDDVANAISDKMYRRHPHVFGTPDDRSSTEQTVAWEALKAEERASKGKGQPTSALDGVALGLPAALRAQKLQKRAARVGFDWPDAERVLAKLDEEVAELKEAVAEKSSNEIEDELGDLLFVNVNLVRKLGFEAEDVLKKANAKFARRFQAMELLCVERGLVFADLDLSEQESLWVEVKHREREV